MTQIHILDVVWGKKKYTACVAFLQESYNTPLEHTPGNPLANYERNPFVACW